MSLCILVLRVMRAMVVTDISTNELWQVDFHDILESLDQCRVDNLQQQKLEAVKYRCDDSNLLHSGKNKDYLISTYRLVGHLIFPQLHVQSRPRTFPPPVSSFRHHAKDDGYGGLTPRR